MAEYVRRRRPPQEHPYWDRLRDRAHPPRVWLPITVAVVVGVATGMIAGPQPALGFAVVFGWASQFGIVAGGVLGAGALIVVLSRALRSASRRDRWQMPLMAGISVFFAGYCLTFVGLAAVVGFYALASGMGWMWGTITATLATTVPTALIVFGNRRRWRARMRHRPQWRSMRVRRRRPTLNVNEVAPPAAVPTEEHPLPSPDANAST